MQKASFWNSSRKLGRPAVLEVAPRPEGRAEKVRITCNMFQTSQRPPDLAYLPVVVLVETALRCGWLAGCRLFAPGAAHLFMSEHPLPPCLLLETTAQEIHVVGAWDNGRQRRTANECPPACFGYFSAVGIASSSVVGKKVLVLVRDLDHRVGQVEIC